MTAPHRSTDLRDQLPVLEAAVRRLLDQPRPRLALVAVDQLHTVTDFFTREAI